MHVEQREALAEWVAQLPPAWTAGVDAAVVEQARTAYDSPGRRYHTWAHVVACVKQLRATPCENPRVVFLALLFHDAVYVAGRADNEQQSAALARAVLSAAHTLDDAELATVERMILATKDHHAHAGSASPDEAALLDIDLSILAAPRDEYARYARAIRDEWVPSVVSDEAFRLGRLAFLRGTLAAPHIFITTAAQQQRESAARANIAWEMGELVGD